MVTPDWWRFSHLSWNQGVPCSTGQSSRTVKRKRFVYHVSVDFIPDDYKSNDNPHLCWHVCWAGVCGRRNEFRLVLGYTRAQRVFWLSLLVVLVKRWSQLIQRMV